MGMTTQEFLAQHEQKAEEADEYTRQSMEDLIQRRYDYPDEQKFEKYQPVLYQVIKDPQELADRESLT